MKEILDYAQQHNVPIIERDGLIILLKTIQNNNLKYILEIGSAIGYSAIQMALLNEDIKIVTIELDTERYQEAVKNIKRFKLEDRIKIYNEDALLFETNDMFDFIFIDAAKAQYTKFFNKFEKNLKIGGIIFSDNLSFHGFVEKRNEIKSRNLKQLVTKINRYITFLKENKKFETTFLNEGDGVSISKKL